MLEIQGIGKNIIKLIINDNKQSISKQVWEENVLPTVFSY